MKIVILDGYALNPGDLSWKPFEELGTLCVYDRTSPEMVVQRAEGAQIVFTNKVIFDQNTMDQLPELRFIGVLATGYNVVDIQAAKAKGIIVANVPAYSTASVAQMVFAHILHFTQQVALHANSVSAGDWAANADFSYRLTPQTELAGKTLGIIGFGRIGKSVATIGKAFGMNVVFYNRSKKDSTPEWVQVDLDFLYAGSDFISINCPLTDENKGFINKESIAKMKRGVFIVNTGRGPLVNEHDLAEALNSDRIGGAGLDVLSSEPPAADNPLLKAKNCFVTPHTAWATLEARTRLLEISVSNLKAFISGNPQNVVNL